MVAVHRDMVAAKKRAELVLLRIPGVTGVDVGYKEVGGKQTGTVAIRVLVVEKKPIDSIPVEDRIPIKIDTHPTDVIQRQFDLHQKRRPHVAALVPSADTRTFTPLQGGISLGPCRSVNGSEYVGTLGAIVKDNVTGEHKLLSNFHVMCIDEGFAIGDLQVQPGLVDGGSCPADVVGTLARQSLGGSVDCAIASISGSRGDLSQIVDIGTLTGTNAASLGDPVRKRGRTTGLTYGIVDSVALSVTLTYGGTIGTVTLTDQFGVKPDTARNPKFGAHGDSGSVVVNDQTEVIGLCCAGDDNGYEAANPIVDVLRALNISILTS